jgi:hypothetical protein
MSMTGLSGRLFVGFNSTSMKRRMIERILNGALTSELTFECEGLYPITIRVSILGSLMISSFNRLSIVTVAV